MPGADQPQRSVLGPGERMSARCACGVEVEFGPGAPEAHAHRVIKDFEKRHRKCSRVTK